MREFDPDRFYVVEGRYLARVVTVAKRLFTERALKNGDDYRDLAQALESAVDASFEYPDEEIDDQEDTSR